MRRQLPAGSQVFDIAEAVNGLRYLVAKAEAFATFADDMFEEVGDGRRHERLAWIVTEAALAAQAALAASNKLTAEVSGPIKSPADLATKRNHGRRR